MLKNFRTFNLSVELYKNLKKVKLPRHLKDQLNRASSSVSLNIAEGLGKNTYKDQRKFFSIAYGSTKEVQAILALAGMENSSHFKLADKTAAGLYKLIHYSPS